MVFFNSLAGLRLALDEGRLKADDQVYVPRELLDAAGLEEWTRLEEALQAIGARVLTMRQLRRIAVLSLAELNESSWRPGE